MVIVIVIVKLKVYPSIGDEACSEWSIWNCIHGKRQKGKVSQLIGSSPTFRELPSMLDQVFSCDECGLVCRQPQKLLMPRRKDTHIFI